MGGGFFMPFLHRIFVKRANFFDFRSYINERRASEKKQKPCEDKE